ncbi:MAG: hypothetical protein ABW003_24860 [Microvirga sp.]
MAGLLGKEGVLGKPIEALSVAATPGTQFAEHEAILPGEGQQRRFAARTDRRDIVPPPCRFCDLNE